MIYEQIEENVRENLKRLTPNRGDIPRLAAACETNTANIRNVLIGKTRPSLKVIVAASNLFKVSPNTLCYGFATRNPDDKLPRKPRKQRESPRMKYVADRVLTDGEKVAMVAKNLGVSRQYVYECVKRAKGATA